jgi:uncharacterized protein
MIEPHRVSPAQFAELSHGTTGLGTLRLLQASQLSRHLLLLRYLADVARPASTDALAVLDAARSRDPESAADTILDPMVGAWIARTVRSLRDDGGRGAAPDADLGHLVALAAAAAARAGVDADLTIRRRDRVVVPTVGVLDLDPDPGGGDRATLTLRVRAGRFAVIDGGRAVQVPPGRPAGHGGRWREVRRLTAASAERQATVMLDDVSPYRDLYHAPPADRVGGREINHWRTMFAEAWRLLTRYAPGVAGEIAGGVRTIVPLQGGGNGTARSATARDAFGAVGLTRPGSPAELAITLVHELQHSKLNALLALVPLYVPDDRTYFAPWRPDPRPIGGLLHGVYAFLAVADLLNGLRAEPSHEASMEKQFSMVREQLRSALESLLDAPSLTSDGRRFVTGMRTRFELLDAVAVPRGAVETARRDLERTRARWCERNGRAG